MGEWIIRCGKNYKKIMKKYVINQIKLELSEFLKINENSELIQKISEKIAKKLKINQKKRLKVSFFFSPNLSNGAILIFHASLRMNMAVCKKLIPEIPRYQNIYRMN